MPSTLAFAIGNMFRTSVGNPTLSAALRAEPWSLQQCCPSYCSAKPRTVENGSAYDMSAEPFFMGHVNNPKLLQSLASLSNLAVSLLRGESCMSADDVAYFRRRAREERKRADAAEGKIAVIHHELADRYEKLVTLLEEQPDQAA